MPNNTLDSEIRSRIDAFVTDLSNLVKIAALDSVAAALGGNASAAPRRGRPPGKRGPGRPKASTNAAPAAAVRRGKRGKRTTADVEATGETLLAHVRANPGQSVTEIAAALGVSSKELKLPVIKLIEAKSLRTEGQRRGTKYFVGGGGGRKAKGARRGKRRSKKA